MSVCACSHPAAEHHEREREFQPPTCKHETCPCTGLLPATRPLWEHKSGDRYALITAEAAGNERDGFRIYHSYYAPSQGSIEQAWRKGLRELDRSDDFNLGVIRDGRLVAILWHHEVVEGDTFNTAAIAGEVGL